MSQLDIGKAVSSDMNNVFTETQITPLATEGVSNQDETEYTNSHWTEYWGYFNEHPELKSAILMKACWDCGKGFTADPETSVILDHVSGMGKDCFSDILFSMDLIRYVGRDSFAEIIRDPETNILINLKPLDPGSIKIVLNRQGIIKRYEQINKLPNGAKVVIKFKPEEIFHLSNNRLADQIHGISVIESLSKTLLADIESFDSTRDIIKKQAKPFIIFKLKTDDQTKIDALVNKVDEIRSKGEDLYIPDDENLLSYEVVNINPSSIILDWRRETTNRFYRALGMPLILFGSSNSTESGGKMEYLAHEQVFEREQRYLENQIWNQLHLKINLIPPTSMLQDLQTDEAKDANQGLEIQKSDVTAGSGK